MKVGTKVERRIDDTWFPAVVTSTANVNVKSNNFETITLKYLDDGNIEKDIIYSTVYNNSKQPLFSDDIKIIDERESDSLINEKAKNLRDMQIKRKSSIVPGQISLINLYKDSTDGYNGEELEIRQQPEIIIHGNSYDRDGTGSSHRKGRDGLLADAESTAATIISSAAASDMNNDSESIQHEQHFPAGNGLNALRVLKH